MEKHKFVPSSLDNDTCTYCGSRRDDIYHIEEKVKTLRERFLDYITSEHIKLSVNVDLKDFADDLSIITGEWIKDVNIGKESYEFKNTLISLTREP